MHTQNYPQIWDSSSKSRTGISACEDCIEPICVEPICPSVEITSQCTDQCVVIACNDPAHEEVNCYGSNDIHCDLACAGSAPDCMDCIGFDEFLQCCTDYHTYTSGSCSADSFPNPPLSWDPSLYDIQCACDVQTKEPAIEIHPSPPSLSFSPAESVHYATSTTNASEFTEPTTPPNHSLLPTQAGSRAASNISPCPSDVVHGPTLTCMWGDCQARFTSFSDLVGHVNLTHLRLPSDPVTPLFIDPIPDLDISGLSCRWRDCNIYPSPESIPSSSDDPVDGMLNILANHLLHDHLGLQHLQESPPVAEETSGPHLEQSYPGVIQDVVTSPLSSQENDFGAHKCCWQSCGQSFRTFADLTLHITDVHVGSGKAQYECFWEGCNRNSGNGFSSKQKICRHLQSHTGHRPYQCTICHQYFSEAATLQQHMRRHTQEKPYVCDYPGCGKSFAITGALTIHKRVHNGDKPFKCKYCNKAFAESSNLSKHLRTHTGARPYSCTEPGCNKSFARPDQLTRHLGVHRKKVPIRMEESVITHNSL